MNTDKNTAYTPADDDADLSALCSRWQQLGTGHGDNHVAEMLERLQNGDARTAPERLRRYYQRNALLAVFIVLIGFALLFGCGFPLYVALGYVVMGMVIGMLSLQMTQRVADTAYLRLPVVEAAAHIVALKRARVRMRTVGIVLGTIVVGMLFYSLWDMGEEMALYGGILGAIVGLGIGITREIRVTRHFRRWLEAFTE